MGYYFYYFYCQVLSFKSKNTIKIINQSLLLVFASKKCWNKRPYGTILTEWQVHVSALKIVLQCVPEKSRDFYKFCFQRSVVIKQKSVLLDILRWDLENLKATALYSKFDRRNLRSTVCYVCHRIKHLLNLQTLSMISRHHDA